MLSGGRKRWSISLIEPVVGMLCPKQIDCGEFEVFRELAQIISGRTDADITKQVDDRRSSMWKSRRSAVSRKHWSDAVAPQGADIETPKIGMELCQYFYEVMVTRPRSITSRQAWCNR